MDGTWTSTAPRMVLVVAIALVTISLGAAPAGAVSLDTIGQPQPIPASMDSADLAATDLAATEGAALAIAAGSNSLVPLMAADLPARVDAVSAVDAPPGGGHAIGKPIDDTQFVRRATESGRREMHAAEEALPQLKDPELKRIATLLVHDHDDANERLTQLAKSKGWPLPPPETKTIAPPAGTASSDFDAAFTADMIAGHERSVALYRAQATGGEDQDLRRYAKDTLPTLEKHLTELRRLQK